MIATSIARYEGYRCWPLRIGTAHSIDCHLISQETEDKCAVHWQIIPASTDLVWSLPGVGQFFSVLTHFPPYSLVGANSEFEQEIL